MKTTITVTGAGGNINFEMKIIELALKKAGFIVNITNDCTSEYWEFHEDQLEAIIKKNKATEINLVANHIPWGG